MVLWEITLGTAYFLGLKRTYRLALRIQRKLITPKHPKIRQFAQRRTRAVFDVALKVHRNIQERDIEVGRSLGNFILRWFDRMKPSAQIRGLPPEALRIRNGTNSSVSMTKHATSSSSQKTVGFTQTFKRESDRHSFTTLSNIWSKPFPTISMMMRPPNPVRTHYRQHSIFAAQVLRSDYGVPNPVRTHYRQHSIFAAQVLRSNYGINW